MENSKPRLTFGEAMRANRIAKNISVAQLADAANALLWSVYKYEADMFVPKVDRAIDMANYLGLTVEEYVGLKEVSK